MNKMLTITHLLSHLGTSRFFGMASLFILLAASAGAQTPEAAPGDSGGQTTSVTKSAIQNKTPLGLTPGAPLGSYPLSDFDNINLYNGNLNLHLPLVNVGGRGAAGFPLMLAIDSKGWRVRSTESFNEETLESSTTYTVQAEKWSPDASFEPGRLYGRRGGVGSQGCGRGTTYYGSTLTRLTFITPDGTEYELRDQLYQGEPMHYTLCVPSTVVSRGRIFTSADGTAVTFISDGEIKDSAVTAKEASAETFNVFHPSGFLMLKDGTRYRIDSGYVTWMRDRNGNMISFDRSNGALRITDSLGREVTVERLTDVAPYGSCVRITYLGFGGDPRMVRVSYDSLSNLLRSGQTLKSYHGLFPDVNGASATETFNPSKVAAIWLPDGRSYRFSYNSYGEMARVLLPSGGIFEYDYTQGSGFIEDHELSAIYRQVIAKRVYKSAGVLESKTTFSDAVVNYPCVGCLPESKVTVEQRDGAGALLAKTVHYFHGSAADSLTMNAGKAYQSWREGREFRTEQIKTSNGTTVLRSTENIWEQGAQPPAWIANSASEIAAPYQVRLAETRSKLVDGNLVSKQTFGYDQYGNRTDMREYDYGPGAAPAYPTRHTSTSYLTASVVSGVTYHYDTDTEIHLRNLVTEQKVYAVDASTGVETLAARAINYYDQYNLQPLAARTDITGLDAAFKSTGYAPRGNMTRLSRWLDGSNTWLNTDQQFDVVGNVVRVTDPRAFETNFEYTDNFGAPNTAARTSELPLPQELSAQQQTYAFTTKIINAKGQVAYTQYDYYLGRAVNAEDANGVVTSGSYQDIYDRPTQLVTDVKNAAAKSQTSFSYSAPGEPLSVSASSDLNLYGDNKLKSTTLYDNLGRTTETRSYETDTAFITVRQQYDALGRVYKTSNPLRTGAAVWATTSYDELGRMTSVETPDGASVKSSYSGNTVTVEDQAGKVRKSTTDALGRLVKVEEDPGTGGLNYVTTYRYDALDNLVRVEQGDVTQGQQVRDFKYDSLGRLISARNPESGTITYRYDENGNLVEKTDERRVSTSSQVKVSIQYAYDALNRITSKSYNDGTPNVTYVYDNQQMANAPAGFDRGVAIGRLVAIRYGTATPPQGSYYGYDALGRVVRSMQTTGTISYSMPSYKYDLAGHLTSEQYPTGRIVQTAYDQASRVQQVSATTPGTPSRVYASQISYTAHGAIQKLKLGNGLWEHTTFNTRLQPTEIGLGVSAMDASQLKLTYTYGVMVGATLDTARNNGNMQSQTISLPRVGTTPALRLVQSYTYDSLNRLQIAQEKKGTVQQWKQGFLYDRFGNRTIDAAATTDEMEGMNPSISAVNNRISKAGYSYDGAGNMTRDEGNHTYQYDAENRLKSFDGGAGAIYSYDGEGHRVRKVVGIGTAAVTTIFVYDAMGKLVSEYGTKTAGSETGVRYYTQDTLGSTRVVTDGAKVVKSRSDYLPFGEEITIGVGGRTQLQGYLYGSPVVDNNRKKFTTYERDNETGLDYAQARYYGSIQGRFTSPDDFLNDAHASDPASWNLYAYVRNNPLRYIDPLGRIVENTNDPNRQKLSPEQMETLAADLRRKSGLSSIAFNSAGRLTYNANEKASGGSAKFRQAIVGAINDGKNVFQLSDASGSAGVHFTDTNWGDINLDAHGAKISTTYQISIDFDDYTDAANYSDSGALEAFSVGVGLYHETNHKVSYDPADPIEGYPGTLRDDVTGLHGNGRYMALLDRPSVIENEAAVAYQLGLPRRDLDHNAHPGPGGTRQISFTDASGRQKFVRWKLEGSR